jgi:hypothetical protein
MGIHGNTGNTLGIHRNTWEYIHVYTYSQAFGNTWAFPVPF